MMLLTDAKYRVRNLDKEPFLIVVINRISKVFVDPIAAGDVFGTERIGEWNQNNITQLKLVFKSMLSSDWIKLSESIREQREATL